jgi:hypothetical protein
MTQQLSTGILIFNASPSCADVYINNNIKPLGKTSLKINDVEPKLYNYVLKSGKTEYKNSILAKSGKTIEIFVNLITGEKKEKITDIPLPQTPTQPPTQPSSQPQTKSNDNYGFDTGKPILQDPIPPLKDTPISISKHLDYYDVANSITTAGLTDPDDFDSPVYNREEIFKIKGRYSEKIIIKNDGFIPLYVIVAHGTSRTSFSKEVPIYSGEIKTYYNIYEIRLRSSVAGHEYRVMEYDLQFSIEKSTLPITISTDSTLHFTGALDIYETETVHIAGLEGNKLKIMAINGQSIQALKYRLIFWSSVTANTTNVNTDKFVTDVVMDFSDNLSAFQIDTGGGLVNQYYLDISDLVALYTDDDQTVTLHVSLQNLSSVAKIAGALGAVQFDFKYVMTV